MSLNDIGVNFRLSYPTPRCDNLKYNRFIYRSGSCSAFSQFDLQQLAVEKRIKTLFDLRSERELNIEPPLSQSEKPGSTYYINHVLSPIEIDAEKVMPHIPTIDDYVWYYQLICLQSKQQLKQLFLLLNQALYTGNVLIACYAGKDRTGVVCYLIHQMLHSQFELVKRDYVASQYQLIRRKDFFLNNAKKRNLSLDAYAKRFLMCEGVFMVFDAWFKMEFKNISVFLDELSMPNDFLVEFRQHFNKN